MKVLKKHKKSKMFEQGKKYNSIYFSGAGYFLPYHLGVVKCFKDNNISFEHTYGISSGGLAAFAMLGGADLDLTIRQIFDLPKQGLFFSWDYMFKLLLCYFEKSRKDNKLSLNEINGKFNIGLLDLKRFTRFFKNSFSSEEDLKNSMVLSSNVWPFVSLLPRVYDGGLYIDPLMVDPYLTDGTLDIAVTPFTFQIHLPEAKVILNGNANFFYTLFHNENIMKNSFFDGYNQARTAIKQPLKIGTNLQIFIDPKRIFYEIMDSKKNWKRETGMIRKIKTKKGKYREIEECLPDNVWDSFLLTLKKTKIIKRLIPLIITATLYWCLLMN